MSGKLKKMQMLVVLMALLLAACGTAVEREAVGTRSFGSQEANVEEIKFRSGRFKVVGDLRMPAGEGPHPAIIMVHGDGPITRDDPRTRTTYLPAMEIFLRNGYAIFSWDRPGSGESTGKFKDLHKQRAEILADAIQVLAEHPSIDPTRIGLWGISQAGWIMPQVLDQTEDVAFMIVVSGGGEDGIEQMAYQVGQKVLCGGGSEEEAALVERYRSQARRATSYEEYREAMEILLGIDAAKPYLGMEMLEKKEWKSPKWSVGGNFDPMDVIEHTTIPVLAFFGELDKNIDPVQGAQAYEAALQKAGNPDYRVVFISGVAHTLVPAKTGCLNEGWGSKLAPEYLETMEAWLQHLSE
jgi:pimeloyl-ACP methyl ester carboxylesterase